MKKKKVVIILVSAVAVAIAIGIAVVTAVTTSKTTISSYHSNNVSDNKFETNDIDISIEELITVKEKWKGEKITKRVQVQNDETVNVVTRVALIPRWVDKDGNPWAGDTSCLRYEFSEYLFTAIDTSIPLDKSYWVPSKPNLNEEQYFYYNGILKCEEITEVLLNKIYIFRESDYESLTEEEKRTAGNYLPEILNDRYEGKKLIIEVKAEAVQAKEDVIKATWGETTGNPKIDEMLKKLCEKNI